MAVPISKNRREVVKRISTDIQSALPALNPFQKENLINAEATAYGGCAYGIERKIPLLEQEFFLQTAKDLRFIQYWGFLKRINLKASTYASGFIPVTGLAGSFVPLGTLFNTPSGIQYEAAGTFNYTIQPFITNIVSISSDGSTITVELSIPHNYSINMGVTIAGVTPGTFNGSFTINEIIDETKFTYLATVGVGSGSGGTSTAIFANVGIQSLEVGIDKNLGQGALLTLDTPLTGVNNNVYVPFDEIRGGSDDETPERYKSRVEKAWRDPEAFWNVAFFEHTALSVPGVTRVWAFATTPAIGNSTTLFVRDDDPDSIFPSPAEIAEVKDALLEFLPVGRDANDTIVASPDNLPIDFTFTDIEPDSLAMRDAVILSLEQFFFDEVDVGKEILIDDYRSAIKDTINPETGEKVISFILSNPTADISVATEELPTLGDVNFS